MKRSAIIQLARESFDDVDISAITSDEDFKNGDYHQAILNVSYGEWQRRSSEIRCNVIAYDRIKKEQFTAFSGTKKQCQDWWNDNNENDELDLRNIKSQDTEENQKLNWGYEDMIQWMADTYGEWFAMMVLLGKYNQQVCNGGHIQYFDNGYASANSGGWGSHDDIHLHLELEKYFEKFWLLKLDEGEKVLEILKEFRPEPMEAGDHDEYEREMFYGQFDELDNRYYKIEEQWMNQLNEYAKSVMSG